MKDGSYTSLTDPPLAMYTSTGFAQNRFPLRVHGTVSDATQMVWVHPGRRGAT